MASQVENSRFYQVNHQMVNNIVNKFYEEDHFYMEQYLGRPSIMSEQMKRVLMKKVIRNHRQCIKNVTICCNKDFERAWLSKLQ